MVKNIIVCIIFITLLFFIFMINYHKIKLLENSVAHLENIVSNLESENENLQSEIDEIKDRLNYR